MSLFDDLPEPSQPPIVNAGAVSTQGSPDKASTVQNDSPSRESEQCIDLFPILHSVIGRKGERLDMQDAHTCIADMRTCFRSPLSGEVLRLSYFAVFDGHGGNRASSFAAKWLHHHLATRFPRGGVGQIDRDIKRVLFDAYKKTDEEFLKEACQQRPHWRDGSTAATVLLVNNTLYIANIGDSKVVLARSLDVDAADGSTANESLLNAICLTREHNPVDYSERQRIQATGAVVQNGRINSILEVSRSFGDYQFKKQGVTSIPDVRKCQLTSNDKFLLIACDGLWKSFPPVEVVQLTNRLLLKEIAANRQLDRSENGAGTCGGVLTQRNVESVCSQLVADAVLRMSGDNVTCILLVFPAAFSPEAGIGSSKRKTDSGELSSDDAAAELGPAKLARVSE